MDILHTDTEMLGGLLFNLLHNSINIQLLESPIPPAAAPAPARPSQKVSSGDISGTKRSIIDPLENSKEKEEEKSKW